ncbi:alpha/beta hydrolase [Afifella sp. JA880]|uniref:alpha/beta fold hydrolase n=1 Tax=Afifella sp. JA880 TaxID=2975280 RepID=UPI0021BAAC78|nr:alpha/beta hydrolase [Afifella sp. JA880]MCT8268538.1 alpha/beta hydrolase [Afifella sp. JA880]
MAILFETEQNPIPDGTNAEFVLTPDGRKLRTAWWHPAASAKRGTVLVLHGRAECIEKYFETVTELRRRGYSVVTFDWRGQGGSSRSLRDPRKGHVDDFSEYLVDLETVMREVALARCHPPYNILAHSTGAAIALLYAARARTQVERMVLTAPLLALSGGRTHFLRVVTGILNYLGLGEMYAGPFRGNLVQLRPFEGNRVTSDKRRYERVRELIEAHPELGLSGPTLAWVHSALRAAEFLALPEFAERVPLPVLIAMAGQESIVSNRAIEEFTMRIKTVGNVRIAGAMHEILQEDDRYREIFWAAFDAFIGEPDEAWRAVFTSPGAPPPQA